jgi:hypothetical protein
MLPIGTVGAIDEPVCRGRRKQQMILPQSIEARVLEQERLERLP